MTQARGTRSVSTVNDRASVARRWYTVAEAAVLLGTTKQTFYRRIREGAIQLPTLDGQLVVPAGRVEQLKGTAAVATRPYTRRSEVRVARG